MGKKSKKSKKRRYSSSEDSDTTSDCLTSSESESETSPEREVAKRKGGKRKSRKRKRVKHDRAVRSSSTESSSSEKPKKKKSKKKAKRQSSPVPQASHSSAPEPLLTSKDHIDTEVKIFHMSKKTYVTSNIIIKLDEQLSLPEFTFYLKHNFLDTLAQNHGLIGSYKTVMTVIHEGKSYEVLGEETWDNYKGVLKRGAHLKIKLKPQVTAEIKQVFDTTTKSYKKKQKALDDNTLHDTLEEIMKGDDDIKGKMPDVQRTAAQRDLLNEFERGVYLNNKIRHIH